MLMALVCNGCNLMALPFFLSGMEPMHEPKCKLASEDKNKVVKVVVLASAGLETRPEFMRVDRELASMCVQHLQDGFLKNKERVTFLPIHRIEKYKDEHANWRSMSATEIGQHFKADYVINMEINSITLYEPGSSNTLYRGRVAVSIDVVNVHKSEDGPIYREEYTCEYPRARGPVPADGGNAAQFRQQFLSVVARELSWRFLAHPIDDELKCD
jgi:hypothetical protein